MTLRLANDVIIIRVLQKNIRVLPKIPCENCNFIVIVLRGSVVV